MIVVGSLILAGLVAMGSANPTGVSCFLEHEVWSSCPKACFRTCQDPHPICGEGDCHGSGACVCEEPYVRGPHGRCVLFTECGGHHHHDRWHNHHRRHRKCGPNEKFKRCKRTCEPTCKKNRPHDCHEPCLDFGCQCESGFVRDRHGDCIPYDLCPSRKHHCGRNERWSNETNLPERKCQKPRCKNQKFPKHCPRYSTNGGCVCKDTYVRDNRGRCVKQDQCHHRSGSSSSRHWDSWDSDSWDRSSVSWDRSSGRRGRRGRRGRHSRSRSSEWWDSRSSGRDWDDSDSWGDSDSWDSDGSWGRHGRHRRGRHGGRRWGRHHDRHHRGRHHHRPDHCHCYKTYHRHQECYDYCQSDDCVGIGCFKRRK